jgi:hypothetical protein
MLVDSAGRVRFPPPVVILFLLFMQLLHLMNYLHRYSLLASHDSANVYSPVMLRDLKG